MYCTGTASTGAGLHGTLRDARLPAEGTTGHDLAVKQILLRPCDGCWLIDGYRECLSCHPGMITEDQQCLFPLFSVAIPGRLEELGYGHDVGSKTGYLNAVYAAGMVVSTFPFTWLGARTKQNRKLLLAALALMAAGVVLFLLGKTYATMLVARTLQGASASGV